MFKNYNDKLIHFNLIFFNEKIYIYNIKLKKYFLKKNYNIVKINFD